MTILHVIMVPHKRKDGGSRRKGRREEIKKRL
jgi:hypothetical protein